MPSLITQRRNVRRPVPPCGRLIKYVEPHSPFQKLIDSARQKQRLSGRELAQKVIVKGKPVSQSSLWIWLHNTNGFPHPKSFTEEHLLQLARALHLQPDAIREALDASRHLYTDCESPMPHAPFDSFRRFIEILDNDKRKTVSLSYVRNLAKNLYNGSLANQAGAARDVEPDRRASGVLLRRPRH